VTIEPEKIRELVFRALDTAVEHGQAEDMRKNTMADEAIDLLDYDSEINAVYANRGDEIFGVPDLLPHIEAWAKARNFTFKPER
jgi:hypothetical protein